jgi:membrane-associated phospholipid phosphatase
MKPFLACIFFFSVFTANAQIDTVYVQRMDAVRGLDVIGHTFSAPVRWKGKDWLKIGGVVVGTAAATLLDKPLQDLFTKHDSKFLDGVERVGYHYGKPYTAIGVTGGFYVAGVILKNEWAKETGLMLASALTTSNLITTFFKNAVGRARPITGLDNYDIRPFSDYASHHSLPSGHTTVAFTISTVLAKQVQSVPLKIVFYSLASITAASRMYMDAHWFSDVAFGGTIAWFCADAAFKRLQQNKWRPIARQHSNVIVKLFPYPGGLTLRASL